MIFFFICINRLSVKDTDGVMKPKCSRRYNKLFAILSAEVFCKLHRPRKRVAGLYSGNPV